MATKPVHKIKLWPLTAAIWKQSGTNGDFYNVTIQRTYKDKDGEWGNVVVTVSGSTAAKP